MGSETLESRFDKYLDNLKITLNKAGLTHSYDFDNCLCPIGSPSISYLMTGFYDMHFIDKKIPKKFLGIFHYTTRETVAEIVSEPKCAKVDFDCEMPCDGLKIKVMDIAFKDTIKSIARDLEKALKEPVKVLCG
jgi:hypothetical protein